MSAEKKIGWILGVLGVIASIINLVHLSLVTDRNLYQIFFSVYVCGVLIFSLLSCIATFLPHKVACIVQYLLLLIVGTAATFSLPESFVGISFIFLSYYILIKNTKVDKKKFLIFYIIYFIVIIIYSCIFKYSVAAVAHSLNILLFMITFGVILFLLGKIPYLSYKPNINNFLQIHEKYKITQAEYRVLKLLVLKEMSNDEIASELCIAVSTVKVHLLSINKKLGVKNRIQIMRLFS